MIPSVSCVVPAYNAEKYITETLDSIRKQTVKPFEIIVVNDGSTDQTESVVRAWIKNNDYPVKIVSQPNGGIGAARLRGAIEAKGDFVAYLSSDDVWAEAFLENAVTLIGDSQNSIAFSDYIRCDEYLRCVDHFHAPTNNLRDNSIQWALKTNMFVNFSAAVFPRRLFSDCSFEEGLKHGEDLIFLLDALLAGYQLVHVPKLLSYYRLHSGQGTKHLSVHEWLLLWQFMRSRLVKLKFSEYEIREAMKRDYELVYPNKTRYMIKRFVSKLLSRNMFGLKIKNVLKRALA